jgi:hypothetical protein
MQMLLDTGRGKIWDKGNDINFLASESRSLISNIPEFYQKKMKRFIETVSGEPIGEFDDEVVERMFGNNSYKGYFKLYVVNFLLETLIMESMEKETAFDKMLKDMYEKEVRVMAMLEKKNAVSDYSDYNLDSDDAGLNNGYQNEELEATTDAAM